ncbi:MAG: carbonic anhydrase family protein [Zoogloeaceae bacterium]|jgi:carbonic anhydrase|nr:carbonic anhydrase family protein [Zoogloeaceae bacterium]
MRRFLLLFFLFSAAAAAQSEKPPVAAPEKTAASPKKTVAAASEKAIAAEPAPRAATWRIVASDKGRSIEMDRASIHREADGGMLVTTRLALNKEIVDIISGAPYKIIETRTRYNCADRTDVTLARRWLTAEERVLREETPRGMPPMPVRSNGLEEKVMREVCRPAGVTAEVASGAAGREKAEAAARALRQSNEAIIRRQLNQIRAALGKPPQPGKTIAVYQPKTGGAKTNEKIKPAAPPDPPASKPPLTWSYDGPGGPEHWAEVEPANLLCKEGLRQSPIDVRDGIEVDLEPLTFDYHPGAFSIVDTGRGIEVEASGNAVSLMGKTYLLERLTFQRPAEETIRGKTYVMGAHLEHRAFDGEQLNVALLFERGVPNAVIQLLWNYLPLETNRPVTPETLLDLSGLLPAARAYHTFMGSMTRPPCEEGVIWAVLRQPVSLSVAQEMIFARLYPALARPTQPAHGRLIKSPRAHP